MTKINIKQLLEKEAKLNLTSTETLNKYYECSGKSYRYIINKIKAFNQKYNTCIRTTNDYIKDVTIIYI